MKNGNLIGNLIGHIKGSLFKLSVKKVTTKKNIINFV